MYSELKYTSPEALLTSSRALELMLLGFGTHQETQTLNKTKPYKACATTKPKPKPFQSKSSTLHKHSEP